MSSSRCESRHRVPIVGVVRCLLAAPHPEHKHYAALPDDRFWRWPNE